VRIRRRPSCPCAATTTARASRVDQSLGARVLRDAARAAVRRARARARRRARALVRLKDVLDERVLDGEKLGKFSLELGAIELIVRARGDDDLGLLLERKVAPRERRVVIVLVHLQDLVVRDDARVGEVVHAGQAAPGHLERDGHHLWQHGHRVWDVDHLFVLGDLVDEVAVEREVVADRHAHAEDAHVRIVAHHVFDQCFCVRVEGAVKVGRVLLLEADAAAQRVRVVVLEDAAGREERDVDAALVGNVGNVHCADHVDAQRLLLVRLAPVHVWPARHASCIEDVRRLHALKLLHECCAVLEPRAGKLEFDPLVRAQLTELAAEPARLAKDEHVHVGLGDRRERHPALCRGVATRQRWDPPKKKVQ